MSDAPLPLPLPLPAALDGAVALPQWAVLRAEGPDAAHFLHGQLTHDVEHLGAGQARLAGYCSPKGRLLASFVVWRPEPEMLYLACSADLLPAVLKRLSMFVLRAKCRLSDASATLRVTGLAGQSAAAWLGDQAPSAVWQVSSTPQSQVIRLPDVGGTPRWLRCAAPEGDAVDAALPVLPLAHWQWLEVASALPRIVAATSDQFVPQMVNLELVGGVNFQKGCYPGQEVVARSQYRGTLKRRAFLMLGDAPGAPGQEVYAVDDPSQPAGMVVQAASVDGLGHLALVELKIAASEQPLHLGTPGGPALRRVAMPYPVPLEAG